MSETIPTTTAVETSKVDTRPTAAESLAKQNAADKAAKEAKAKAKAGKPKSTKTVKAKDAKTKTVPSTNGDGKKGAPKKEGLRKMQIRALLALDDPKAKDGLPMEKLAAKAGISSAVMRQGIGPVDPDCRENHNKAFGYKCLLSTGHVKVNKREFDDKTDTVYVITALGSKAVSKIDEKPGKAHPAPYSKRTPAEIAKEKKAEEKAAAKAKAKK